mmetsp:Transcript_24170/g.37670  ORF Transcript_24170/g.37670 Transcript_24170/m.37670 type:complete len:207 (-) Transcript_24170:105-725(-)
MTTFVHSFLHLAYTASLLAFIVFVTLNISVPVSLQWPVYCNKSCPREAPLYDLCRQFCEIHDSVYSHLKEYTQISIVEVRDILENKIPIFSELISTQPNWFVLSSILLSLCAVVSVLLWCATLLSDVLVQKLAPWTTFASAVIFCASLAHAYFAFADDAYDLNDVLTKIEILTQTERVMLALLYAFPILQVLVVWMSSASYDAYRY